MSPAGCCQGFHPTSSCHWDAGPERPFESCKCEWSSSPQVQVGRRKQVVILRTDCLESPADKSCKLESLPHVLAPVETLEAGCLDVVDIPDSSERVQTHALVSPVSGPRGMPIVSR